MRQRLASFTLAALAAASVSAQACDGAQAIAVRQPGDYGRIDIGDSPPPVVYAQPLVIDASAGSTPQAPVYLYVPPTQKGHWGRYCNRYAACDQPVLFVQHRWVIERYTQHRD
ncbi:hypothetical protein HZ992_25530 [Rhizobacter sp. AJA081-3]|uniref:hypothetical protein n=1 Tax=Rhizobacter sp. AJA081-3 TaxID=2753607 RepID=UPI001ADF0B31|nr:hypothetical protein [Rhizobacter sp. AJA081-3]QTN23419.1 hypothetical protein HZ992_25530 [Rhizobacter sp. AJA081-3]